MNLTDNTVFAVKKYFEEKLDGFFESGEIEASFFIVIAHYFSISKQQYLMDNNKRLSESDILKVIYCVKRLKDNEPLAYIIGKWEFYGLPLKVNEHTLIPRPETEELVDLILKENEDGASVLDIGTGTGCIPISIKKNFPNSKVYALDVSDEALSVSEENALMNDVDINFVRCDILTEALRIDKVDVIVSNPPYIPVKDKQEMKENVLNYEPHLALFVEDEDPCVFYRKISGIAREHLNANGKLYFEIHEKYGDEVKAIMEEIGFDNLRIIADINGRNRIICGQLNKLD